MAFRASILGGLAALFLISPAYAGWVSIGGEPSYVYTDSKGKEYWHDVNTVKDWVNNTTDKTVNARHETGMNWNNVIKNLNDKYPSSVIEKTRKIPWADVGKGVKDVAVRVGPRALGWAGIASVVVTAGIEVCKQVDGAWCKSEPAVKTDPTNYSNCALGTGSSGYGYFPEGFDWSLTKPTPWEAWNLASNPGTSPSDDGTCRVWVANKGFVRTVQYCGDGSIINLGLTCGAGTEAKQVVLDPTQMQQLIDAIKDSSAPNWSGAAQEIATNEPDLAKSPGPLQDTYKGPATVAAAPIHTTETLTNPDGTTTLREATQQSTANITYGDSVNVNNIQTTTNITENGTVVNNTTTTTTPTPSPSTTPEGLATEATLSKVLGELQASPTAPNYSAAESAQQGAYDGIKDWAEKAPERKPYGEGIQWTFKFPTATCQNLKYNIPLVGMSGEFDICTPIATIRNILYWFFAVLTIFAIYNLWFIRTR